MLNRREFLRGGLSAFALGTLGTKAVLGSPIRRSLRSCAPSGGLGINATTPFLEIPSNPPSVMVDGMPFAEWFFGDDFNNDHIPFHFIPDYFNGGPPPEPAGLLRGQMRHALRRGGDGFQQRRNRCGRKRGQTEPFADERHEVASSALTKPGI